MPLTVVTSNELENANNVETIRVGFRLPKLFDFATFKRYFNKNYSSVVEHSIREKLFLAKSFQAFVSMVGYKYAASSKYQSVNQMSDWTKEERKRTFMKPESYYQDAGDMPVDKVGGQTEASDMAEETLLDADQIREKFEEILKNPDSKPGYHEIAKALEEADEDDVYFDDESELEEEETFFDALEGIEDDDSDSNFAHGKGIKGYLYDKYEKLKDHLSIILNSARDYLDTVIMRVFLNETQQSDEPDEIFHDLRKSGCFNTVRDQKACGSCYIFATIALYEWAYCHLNGKKIKFSEQYAVDCGGIIKMDGCNGGTAKQVNKFVEKFGFEMLDWYRYQAKESECPFEFDRNVESDSVGFMRLDRPDLYAIPYINYENQLKYGPILVTVRVDDAFPDYGGGVDLNENCEQKKNLHAMLIVGSGRENGYEYWLMRNSYGFVWGEKGYYRMRKSKSCFDGFGMTLKSLLPRSPVPIDTNSSSGMYKFFENPRYDMHLLAKKFGHKTMHWPRRKQVGV